MLPSTQLAPAPPTREFAASVITGALKLAVENLPEEFAVLSLDEIETRRKPTEVDFYLRRNLWKQIELCQAGAQTEIVAATIYAGVCSRANYDKMLKDPIRVAWLMIYPQNFQDRMAAGLAIGLTNLIDFISKKPNAENAAPWIKAMEMLINRVHGPMIQKIQAQHAHLNLNKPIARTGAALPVADRLKEIQEKLGPKEIDVTPEPAPEKENPDAK